MKINELIRKYRISQNLTQEQVATRLGVTAPAVNKWEKGTSYPDITLLPALARLLGTDLNTLLSFRDDLTSQEIALFLNDLSQIFNHQGFTAAYTTAIAKINEYPTCYPLILNTALSLEGMLMLTPDFSDLQEKYSPIFESLYLRVLASDDLSIRTHAQSLLISKYMGRKDYAQAETLLKEIPDKIPVDKKHLQASIHLAQGRLTEAAQMEEEKLLSATTEFSSALFSLLEIALKEGRTDDAEYIADVSKNFAELFDLYEYNSYVAHLQLYTAQKDRENSLKTLIPMLKSLTKKWEPQTSPLYRHLPTKKSESNFGPKLQQSILASVLAAEETEFLRDAPELQEFLNNR